MQAVLILAHKNSKQVIRLAKLLSACFEVYIHFDKKYSVPQEDWDYLREMPRMHVFQKISVNWGSISIVDATLLLFGKAYADKRNTYFHIISGQDWPVRPGKEIYRFYENTDKIFMRCAPAEGVYKSREHILLWQKYYFNYDKIPRQTLYGKVYHRLSMAWQTLRGVDKFKDLKLHPEIYQGSQWMDLPRNAVEQVFKRMNEEPDFYKIFQTGFCPDEFFFQTVLWNSPLRGKIVNDNHRYICWNNRYGNMSGTPSVLTLKDMETVRGGISTSRGNSRALRRIA